jgi:hypothetical protein
MRMVALLATSIHDPAWIRTAKYSVSYKTWRLEERNLWHTKEELKEGYSVTLNLPLRPLWGVTVTTMRLQALSREHSLLRGVTVAGRAIASSQQRAQVAVSHAEMKLFIKVQHNYKQAYWSDATVTETTKAKFHKFLVTGIVLTQFGVTHWRVPEERIEEIRIALQISYSETIRKASSGTVCVSRATGHRVLHLLA